jgi:hypothetical protein
MNSADWKAVWDAAIVAYGHQPMEIRVGLALAVAFLALMVLEGLRASFLPQRHAGVAEHKSPAVPPQAASSPEAAKPQAKPTVRLIGPAYAIPPHTLPQAMRRATAAARKRDATPPRRHRSPRPKIRRAAATIHDEQSDSLS